MRTRQQLFLGAHRAGFVDVNHALVQVALPDFGVARRYGVQHLLRDPPQIGFRR